MIDFIKNIPGVLNVTESSKGIIKIELYFSPEVFIIKNDERFISLGEDVNEEEWVLVGEDQNIINELIKYIFLGLSENGYIVKTYENKFKFFKKPKDYEFKDSTFLTYALKKENLQLTLDNNTGELTIFGVGGELVLDFLSNANRDEIVLKRGNADYFKHLFYAQDSNCVSLSPDNKIKCLTKKTVNY